MNEPKWTNLLQEAVEKPGVINQAYSLFWNYSSGNQMLALTQCFMRGIEPGPIASFMRWKELGRHVKRGEKALTLCMPVTCKRERPDEGGASDEKKEEVFTRFIYRNNWFALVQTEGQEFKPEPLPNWDKSSALAVLAITEAPFEQMDGNCQGYAKHRTVAVSPIAANPHKTLFHEIAHVILGHTEEGSLNDGERTPKNLREVEAEATTLICLESLGMPGAEFCRGYIQSWLGGAKDIPERSAQKIFSAADKIIKAGRPEGVRA